ncbi:MAG: hypothetical protein EXR11_10770 [Rhodospirillaceae bacterium]|nr:hypothetical protein [Rhodospirillaceae bacterium]
MDQEIYADTIGEITVSGSTVRIDLMTLAISQRDEAGRLKPVFKQRIVFPIEGFAHAVEAMLQMRGELVKRGALRAEDTSGIKLEITDPSRRPN